MRKQERKTCEDEIRKVLLQKWEDYLSFLCDNSDAFKSWFLENDTSFSYDALTVIAVALYSAEKGTEKNVRKYGVMLGIQPLISLYVAFAFLERNDVCNSIYSLLDAETSYSRVAFECALYDKTIHTSSAKRRSNILQNKTELDILKIYRKEKELTDGGRKKGTKTRQQKAQKNWKIVDEAIEAFYINGEGFRRDCTNKKIKKIVFDNVGKKLRYSEKTVEQRVKVKAAEYRRKYASKNPKSEAS